MLKKNAGTYATPVSKILMTPSNDVIGALMGLNSTAEIICKPA